MGGALGTPVLSDALWRVATIVGAMHLVRLAWVLLMGLLRAVRIRFGRSAFERYGPGYAVVTGAAQGMGLEWSRALAAQGFDLVLVDINEEGVRQTGEALQEAFGCSVRAVKFDFSCSDDEGAMEKLVAEITEGIDVCVLVNNVGMMSATPTFTDSAVPRNVQVCKVNMFPMLVLTQLLYTRVFSKRDRRSAVVNMASLSGLTPWPGSGVYSASKAFVHTLSVCMSKELEERVDVLSVTPAGVSTSMVAFDPDGMVILAPGEVVRAALPYLGAARSCVGHWAHRLQAAGIFSVQGELRLALLQLSMALMPPPRVGAAPRGKPPFAALPRRLAVWLATGFDPDA